MIKEIEGESVRLPRGYTFSDYKKKQLEFQFSYFRKLFSIV